MNGLVTYFYPKQIDGKTFPELIFYFEKDTVVNGFYFINQRLNLKVDITNNTVSQSNEQVWQKIQDTLEVLYNIYKERKFLNAPLNPEVERYFSQLPEKPERKLNIPSHRMWNVE